MMLQKSYHMETRQEVTPRRIWKTTSKFWKIMKEWIGLLFLVPEGRRSINGYKFGWGKFRLNSENFQLVILCKIEIVSIISTINFLSLRMFWKSPDRWAFVGDIIKWDPMWVGTWTRWSMSFLPVPDSNCLNFVSPLSTGSCKKC